MLKNATSMNDLLKLDNIFKEKKDIVIENSLEKFSSRLKGEKILKIKESHDIRYLIELKSGKIAASVNDSTVKIYDPQSGKCELVFIGHSSMITCILELKDGYFATSSYYETIKIWKPNGICDKTFRVHMGNVMTIYELKNGKIISSATNNTMIVWNRDGNCEKIFSLDHFHYSFTLLNDGRVLCGCLDDLLRIWNPNTFSYDLEIKGHQHSVVCVRELSDGRYLSSSYDRLIILWNKKLWKKGETI